MVGVDRLDRAPTPAESVDSKPHTAIGVDRCDDELCFGIHEPLNAFEKKTRIVEMLDHFAGDDHVECLIKVQLIQTFKIGPVKVLRPRISQNIEALLVVIE